MESLFSSLGIEWGKLIAQMVNFAILAFVLTKLVYNPLLKALEDREKTIKKISDDSSSSEKTLEEARIKQEEILNEARKQSANIIKESENQASSLRQSLLEQAKKDADKIIIEGEKRLIEEKDKFYADLRNELVGLVSTGIEKTVGGYITKEAETKLKEEALSHALSLKK